MVDVEAASASRGRHRMYQTVGAACSREQAQDGGHVREQPRQEQAQDSIEMTRHPRQEWTLQGWWTSGLDRSGAQDSDGHWGQPQHEGAGHRDGELSGQPRRGRQIVARPRQPRQEQAQVSERPGSSLG
jgi:hypothetical protein